MRSAPYYAPVPVYTWSGFYIGANLGVAWRDDDWHDINWANLGIGFPNGVDDGPGRGDAGFTGGVTVGANWQFNQVVFGVEGDANYIERDIHNRFAGAQFTVAAQPGVTFTVSGGDQDDASWFGTLRGRVGIAFDRFLIYGTGGFAFSNGGDEHAFRVVGRNARGTVVVDTGFTNDGNTNVGYTVGVGAEVALMPSISVKLEYLFVTFDPANVIDPVASIAARAPVVFEQDRDTHIIRGGVNVKFGGLFGAY